MGQQEQAASQATQDQAAACLKHYFDQRVADAMPMAFRHALTGPVTIAGWLYRAAADGFASQLGVIDEDHLLFVGSLSVPSLLVLLMDKRQPVAVTVAARDALQAHFLADSAVKAQIVSEAEGMARRAVRHLAQQQQIERAERQSLYGNEQPVVAHVGVAA